jgi:hypothetical protein
MGELGALESSLVPDGTEKLELQVIRKLVTLSNEQISFLLALIMAKGRHGRRW